MALAKPEITTSSPPGPIRPWIVRLQVAGVVGLPGHASPPIPVTETLQAPVAQFAANVERATVMSIATVTGIGEV